MEPQAVPETLNKKIDYFIAARHSNGDLAVYILLIY
jgi:hypothetical protein